MYNSNFIYKHTPGNYKQLLTAFNSFIKELIQYYLYHKITLTPTVMANVVHNVICYINVWDFPGGSVVNNLLANAKDVGHAGLIAGSGRSPGGGNDNPFWYFCLGKPMDKGSWRATVLGVARVGQD